MGAIPVYNLTGKDQSWGQHTLPSAMWTDIPRELASTLAGMHEYRADSAELIGDYKFLDDGGTFLGWSSPLMYCDGYGSVGIEMTRTFLKMGVALSIYPRDYDPASRRFGSVPLDRWEKEGHIPASVVDRLKVPQDKCFYGINCTWPPEVQNHPFARGIGYTMFETTLPPRYWAESMNNCRRVIVPCAQNVQAFRDIGVTVPMDVVGLGVDADRWTYFDRTGNPFGFTFLMSAGITMRKNPVGAARAFVDAFPNVPKYADVRLILKTRARRCASGFWDWEEEIPNDPRIQVICEDSTPEEMVFWMHSADAFVFPSHSEGFGLPPLQAMCTGLPVIVSDNSGMSEYCDDRYNYPVPCHEVKVPDQANGGFPTEWGDVGNWWNPNHEALVETMRSVYENRDKSLQKGKAAADWVRERWTWENSCRAILDVVMKDAKEDGQI